MAAASTVAHLSKVNKPDHSLILWDWFSLTSFPKCWQFGQSQGRHNLTSHGCSYVTSKFTPADWAGEPTLVHLSQVNVCLLLFPLWGFWAVPSSLGVLAARPSSSPACPEKKWSTHPSLPQTSLISALKILYPRKPPSPRHSGVTDYPKIKMPKLWHLSISFLGCKMLGVANTASVSLLHLIVPDSPSCSWLHPSAPKKNSLEPSLEFRWSSDKTAKVGRAHRGLLIIALGGRHVAAAKWLYWWKTGCVSLHHPERKIFLGRWVWRRPACESWFNELVSAAPQGRQPQQGSLVWLEPTITWIVNSWNQRSQEKGSSPLMALFIFEFICSESWSIIWNRGA